MTFNVDANFIFLQNVKGVSVRCFCRIEQGWKGFGFGFFAACLCITTTVLYTMCLL